MEHYETIYFPSFYLDHETSCQDRRRSNTVLHITSSNEEKSTMVPKSDEITDARANLVTGKQNTADNTSVQQVTHYGNFDN